MSKRIIFFIVLILAFSFSFTFAASGSASVTVPYCEPSTGPTTGYLTVYTDEGRTYTYTWSFYGATDSIAFTQGGLTVGVVDGGDKLLIRLVEMDATNTVYGTLICYGGGGVDVLSSGAVSVSNSITVNPTGNITHYYTSGYIGSLSTDFDNFGRLDISWGNTDYSSQLNSIISSLGSIKSNTSLTYEKLDLLFTIYQNNFENFSQIWYEMTERISIDVNTVKLRLVDILDLLNEWRNNTIEDLEDLPSDSISDSITEEHEIISGTDKSDSFDDVINSVDFGEFSGGFQLFWTLVDRLFATNPVFVILTVMCLSLGLISFVFNRR